VRSKYGAQIEAFVKQASATENQALKEVAQDLSKLFEVKA